MNNVGLFFASDTIVPPLESKRLFLHHEYWCWPVLPIDCLFVTPLLLPCIDFRFNILFGKSTERQNRASRRGWNFGIKNPNSFFLPIYYHNSMTVGSDRICIIIDKIDNYAILGINIPIFAIVFHGCYSMKKALASSYMGGIIHFPL